MSVFLKADWIWIEEPGKDVYADFRKTFQAGEGAELLISADSNYAVWCNGRLCGFAQYGDFPDYKVYDRIDLAPYLCGGENLLEVTVWHYGESNMTYKLGNPGLIFEVRDGERVLAASGAETEARLGRGYESRRCKKLTSQLGYGFRYDAKDCGRSFGKAMVSEGAKEFYPRPIERLVLGNRTRCVILEQTDTRLLIDLGRESCGFLDLDFETDSAQELLVSYGEHLRDGHVARIIQARDFCLEYAAKSGHNLYMNPFRRLAGRYLEIESRFPIRVSYIGLREVYYPVNEIPYDAGSDFRQKVWETCVRTLRLCMHEHYEDCPWREQALYAMDSRNQMLCGYHAFGEYKFARASLVLMAKNLRPDGLLEICAPSDGNLPIPFFSLIYAVQVLEYVEYSGDLSILKEVMTAVEAIAKAFDSRRRDGLIPNFTKPCWNFYEWSEGNDDITALGGKYQDGSQYDLIINAMYVVSGKAYEKLLAMSGRKASADYCETAKRIYEKFWTGKFFKASTVNEKPGILGNSLALLAGAASGAEAKRLAERMLGGEGMVPVTLSMVGFYYDALMSVGDCGDQVLEDIDRKYRIMLEAGATTFWETELGSEDFGGAGSLCHGWSAMPIHYYKNLLK